MCPDLPETLLSPQTRNNVQAAGTSDDPDLNELPDDENRSPDFVEDASINVDESERVRHGSANTQTVRTFRSQGRMPPFNDASPFAPVLRDETQSQVLSSSASEDESKQEGSQAQSGETDGTLLLNYQDPTPMAFQEENIAIVYESAMLRGGPTNRERLVDIMQTVIDLVEEDLRNSSQ